MALTVRDTAGCIINPLQKSLLDENPKLREYVPDLPEPVDEEDIQDPFEDSEIEAICRYVILMYDPQSPLIKLERDLNSRKYQAAQLSNLKSDPEYLSKVYSCEHPLVAPIAIGYLRFFAKSREYAAIVATEAKYWESITGIMTPVDGKSDKDRLQAIQVKSALSDEIDKDLKRLVDYESKYYAGDESLEIAVRQKMTPEGMAKMIKK